MERVKTMKIEELTPRSKRVNLAFKVLEKNDVKNVRSKRDRTPHAVTESLVGDDTGTILLTLWDEDIEKIEVGTTYKLENGYITIFKGTIRLNIGRYGEIEEFSEDIEVNTENNMSEKVYDEYQRPREYTGMGADSYWPG
jgi:replication factor A1